MNVGLDLLPARFDENGELIDFVLPCRIMEERGEIKVQYTRDEDGELIIDCENMDCPFKKLDIIRGIMYTYCSIRGKVYEDVIDGLDINDSLYNNHTNKQAAELLRKLEAKREIVEDDEKLIKTLKENEFIDWEESDPQKIPERLSFFRYLYYGLVNWLRLIVRLGIGFYADF